MNIVESHPFKTAFLLMIPVSLFAIIFHFNFVYPHDWIGFAFWLPIYNSLLLIPPSLNFLFNKYGI